MKIAVWKTGHIIADTLAEAVSEGLIKCGIQHIILNASDHIAEYINTDHAAYKDTIHIGYGILRGMDKVFRACDETKRPWFNIDKGYWKPGHYDGYYRISLNGTQQTTGLDKLQPDYDRWDRLGLSIDTRLPNEGSFPRLRLVCPPTDHVAKFFGEIDERYWSTMNCGNTHEWLFRRKGCERSLQQDLNVAREVHTFNSSVGWEALRQGIDVTSDPTHSILGAYQKMLDFPLCSSYNERRRFFAIQSVLQLNLSEIREGKLLWPLIQNLLRSTSVGIHASQ